MNKKTIEKIYEQKLDLSQYILLKMIQNKEDFLSLLKIKKVEGIINLLVRKEYLTEDLSLSAIGEKILQDIGEEIIQAPIEEKKENDFDAWTNQLLEKLKAKLKEYTGKQQIMGFGNVYFIPGIYDLRNFLIRFVKEYRISIPENREKIEKILVNHVAKCCKSKSYSPAIKYFICKTGTGSQLAAALENYQEEDEKPNTEDKSSIEGVYFG